MRNLLLSAALIAVPVASFSMVEMAMHSGASGADAARSASLGDLGPYETIVSDTQSLAKKGEFAAAEKRATDLETLWDQNAAKLREADPSAWGVIDEAADKVFAALRTKSPEAKTVMESLDGLQTALADPVPSEIGAVQKIAGVAVTDQTGHALPCEAMIGQLRDTLGGKSAPKPVADLQAKALERCNADDDTRADAFSAQALAMLKN
ncbi:hypothetical protein BMI90_11325 [Thioclava sp. L04-15]|uniref:hypothetical protein n=1 Tax=Thioclava sp. L04-15 TaxID=1915318 RepID=UPI0009966317|nr:hypothetical protein [Thioclava sp. L04-15]OOY27791.1 hypothetical protein BMI90_11325 [Thioclava sp. L04-15]